MHSNTERLAVNAAIEKLTAREDEDGNAAITVIRYGSKLKKTRSIQVEYSRSSTRSGSEISGYSPGSGNVTVENRETSKQKEWGFGIYKDRVGYYRLWKEEEGQLQFHHFWKSNIATKAGETEGPDTYYLGYDPTTLTPKYLAILRKRVICTLWFGITFEISRYYLEQIYGTAPKIRRIGMILR